MVAVAFILLAKTRHLAAEMEVRDRPTAALGPLRY